MAQPSENIKESNLVAKSQKTLHFLHYDQADSTFICGAVAGMVSKTCIAPIERIKMTFQVSRETFTYAAARQRGRDLINKGGFFSMWKGHSTTLLRVAPYAGFSYTFHDYTEHLFKKKLQSNILPPMYKFAAGAAAGFGGTIITYPLDVLRVRLALGSSWKEAIAQKGYYQGLSPTLLGIVPYSGIAWLAKQTALESFHVSFTRKPVLLEALFINAFAGLVGQFATYPLDVIRRRMQVANAGSGFVPSLRSSLYTLFVQEGFRGFWKGFSLNIIKGPIALSISLTVYDLLRGTIQDFSGSGG